jgi:SpoVK/Ycf46/Vps4 family AAA+-type ATPase
VDWLQTSYPEAVTRGAVGKECPDDELLGMEENVAVANPGSEQGTQKEPKSEAWIGSVEVEWKGSPIHFYSPFMEQCLDLEPLILMATKSNAALQNLLCELKQYGLVRKRNGNREILIVNGPNQLKAPISWNDVLLPAKALQEIRNNVEGFFSGAEKYERLGLPLRRGLLFVGPPGCGKTMTINAIANTVDATCVSILPGVDVDDQCVERAINWAAKQAPAVLILEDLDKLLEAGKCSLVHLLKLLDDLKPPFGILIIATCNEPDRLDPALIHRPSRFDRVWRFELPKYEQRLELLRKKGGTYFSASALETTARRSEGFSMAYVQEIVINALLECANDEADPTDEHLLKSLATLRVQRKEASKPGELMVERETVGFYAPGNVRN